MNKRNNTLKYQCWWVQKLMTRDWLIDLIEFYAVSAIFQPCKNYLEIEIAYKYIFFEKSFWVRTKGHSGIYSKYFSYRSYSCARLGNVPNTTTVINYRYCAITEILWSRSRLPKISKSETATLSQLPTGLHVNKHLSK